MARDNKTSYNNYQIPLSFLKNNEEGTVTKVRAKGDLHHRLEHLGFVENTPVKVINENAGNIIAVLKETQIAIDASIAQKIIVIPKQ